MANRHLSREVRFWAKVRKTESCWIWTGALQAKGSYGQFCDKNKHLRAHRVAYELCVGPIPEGLTLDHLCFNKVCVNPAHLEPVTSVENRRRWAESVTACPAGHPYDEENTYVDKRGRRACRECGRLYARAKYWRNKGQPPPPQAEALQ